MLVLVREFDDRFGYAKWSFKTCAEWLAWRCGISLSAAREKVRTAQALRRLPAISAAFADGRLSYTKVRALTRVAHAHDEDLLLRLRARRNGVARRGALPADSERAPESVITHARVASACAIGVARRSARDVATDCRAADRRRRADRARARLRRGGRRGHDDVDPDAVAESKGTAWRAQQADALVAVAKAYLDGGADPRASVDGGSLSSRRARRTKNPSAEGRAGRICRSRRSSGCSATAASSPWSRIRPARRSTSAASSARCRRPLKRALYARDRGCTFPGCQRKRYLDGHHLSIGSTAARRAPIT